MSDDKLKDNEHPLTKGMINKITQCLDEMTDAKDYEARYYILRQFSLDSYKAGGHQALDSITEDLKELFEA